MAWLIDPRKWDDPWYRSLPSDAREVFSFCLFGNVRTSIPGLVKGVSVVALSDGLAFTVEQTEHALNRALMPDDAGKAHLYFDATARVIRVPNAPKYNKCTNPNQLVGWFRAWRDVPECALKAAHLETVPAGVNLANAEMLRAWNRTFGPVIAARQNGVALSSYADLDSPRHHPQLTLQGFGKASESLPLSERESGSGSGSGSKALASLSEASPDSGNSRRRGNLTVVKESGGQHGASGSDGGVGPRENPDGAGGRPGGPTNGGAGGRGTGGAPAGGAPKARRKLPPGLE
jgi:hypothetical protein